MKMVDNKTRSWRVHVNSKMLPKFYNSTSAIFVIFALGILLSYANTEKISNLRLCADRNCESMCDELGSWIKSWQMSTRKLIIIVLWFHCVTALFKS